MTDTQALAKQTLETMKVAVFIVAYNAEKYISGVLKRIPPWVAERLAEIYIIDDHSSDNTVNAAREISWPDEFAPLRIYKTPYNQGYGGNQRLGFLYAIEREFDIVVLLHGDGQYAPEVLPQILAPYAEGADAVFGSRFLKPRAALKGGMPLYKYVGNRILTRIQNYLLKSNLSEMHSGYRSYRTSVLKTIPFETNALWFDFDADIIIQLLAGECAIKEIPIPTYYGDEICHVNGLLYAWKCVKAAVKYKIMQYEIFYEPKFDVHSSKTQRYTVKMAKNSLHHFIRSLPIEANTSLIDVGGGDGSAVSKAHAENGIRVTCIDRYVNPTDNSVEQFAVDLDKPWQDQFPIAKYDTAFALDVLEHLYSPEGCASEIFKHLRSGGKLFASTGNISYFPLRLMHFLGFFNYGRRGILDHDHRRLFTVSTFRCLLRTAGFRIDKVIGFGPPVRDISAGRSHLLNFIDAISAWFARWWPRLFAYQFLCVCTRLDSPQELMEQVFSETNGKPSGTLPES